MTAGNSLSLVEGDPAHAEITRQNLETLTRALGTFWLKNERYLRG